ncbi:TetR/AcrR family transcriptional regulator [Calothrix sp. NIES-3974]|uniref:TetR/AcrR family transcriptional regulator n=1 Tax=Calothrix sp. NIES-3974 TaxID=2005462 RepID=UPI000B5E81A6|nr:TetR/AcrR family transcriptional regulator [Calothrix sp. NIES-3974]BAZ04030.1 transcriptional regulator [Calothrix sp. NIES-3974]
MPKIVDKELYRQELLEKCFDLFAQKGYGSITMRQIAKGLNVSTGTLYHYFPSKQALFEQLVEEKLQRDIYFVTKQWQGIRSLDDKAEILADYLAKNLEDQIKWTYLMVDFAQNQEREGDVDGQRWQETCDRYRWAIYEFIGVENPIIADFVMSLIDGLILEKLLGNLNLDVKAQCMLLAKMVNAYLEKENRMQETGDRTIQFG